MFAPRALRPLARTARSIRVAPRAGARLMSSAAPRPGQGGRAGAEEPCGANTLLLAALSVAAIATAGSYSWEKRKPLVTEKEEEEIEEEIEEEAGEEVEEAEEEQTIVEAVEAKVEKVIDELSELINDAEVALGIREAAPVSGQEALAAEAASQGAFNEETGEINWDCPCLGGMATGPCGEEFKAAFSCFVYSEAEPKGIDCVEKFKAMQDCFREHPDVYGEEDIEDDEEPSSDEPAPAKEEK